MYVQYMVCMQFDATNSSLYPMAHQDALSMMSRMFKEELTHQLQPIMDSIIDIQHQLVRLYIVVLLFGLCKLFQFYTSRKW